MITGTKNRRRPRLLLVVATLLVAVGIFMGPGATAANAQSSDPCAISNFTTGTSIDFTAYSACVAGENEELARTGSDTGLYAGFGAGLLALGVAAVWSSRRYRTNASV